MQSQSKRKDWMKVIILGDIGVGKTSVVNQYVKRSFDPDRPNPMTLQVEYHTKEVIVGDTHVLMQIWDTVGDEKFRSIVKSYYRNVDACVLMYDVTRPESLLNMDSWRREFLEVADPEDPDNFPFALFGNKVDVDNIKVDTQLAKDWCQERNDMPYFGITAKEANNIDMGFLAIATKAVERRAKLEGSSSQQPKKRNTVTLNQSNNNSSETSSCKC